MVLIDISIFVLNNFNMIFLILEVKNLILLTSFIISKIKNDAISPLIISSGITFTNPHNQYIIVSGIVITPPNPFF